MEPDLSVILAHAKEASAVALIVWAELRLLPHVKALRREVRATAVKVGAMPADSVTS